MKMNQKGFINVVLIVLVVILAGAVGYFALIKKSPTPTDEIQSIDSIPLQQTPPVTTTEVDKTIFNLNPQMDKNIVETIFGEKEITVKEARNLGIKGLEQKKETEIIRIRYPKVITIRDENIEYETLIKSIKFLDEKGIIKKELPVRRYIPDKQSPSVVSITKNKKYVTVNDILKEDKGGVGGAEVSIFNTDGELLRKIKHDFRDPFISPNGKYIVGAASEPGSAPIGIFNQTGLIKKLKKGSPGWNIDFSKDGSFFAITIETKLEGTDKYRADLLIVDENGNELWRKNDLTRGISAGDCPISISDDNIITVITGVDEFKVYRFSKEGNLISAEDGNLDLFRQIKKQQ